MGKEIGKFGIPVPDGSNPGDLLQYEESTRWVVDKIDFLEKQLAEEKRKSTELLKEIKEMPELESDMPPKLWERIKGSKELTAYTMRTVAKRAKIHILKCAVRIEEESLARMSTEEEGD